MTKTGKKGATLAELCVVLALIAVVSGMVVSFALTISARTRLSAARLNAMGDLELVESVTGAWMSRAGTLSVENGVLVDGDGNTISFDSAEKTLAGGDITVTLEQVSDIEFEFLTNDTTGDVLCICTVTLSLPGLTSDKTETRTICINPHVGDVYGEQEGESDENA